MRNRPATAAFVDQVIGDDIGIAFPACADALLDAGPDFLTRAFRAFGALSDDNEVISITASAPCPGGSTGRKLFLSVAYRIDEPQLHRDLFVKFSRDFTDPRRDRMRHELRAETQFAAVSRMAGFPISVPVAYFADYHQASGTGILITERVAFGQGGIEPHYPKFLDHDLDEPVCYYEALVKALSRLAAAHRSGSLPRVDQRFPYSRDAAERSDRIPHNEAKLRMLVRRYAAFAKAYPALLPAAICEPAWIAQLEDQVAEFLAHETLIKRFLQSDPALIALCHWNAQIDNAWFWRNAEGELRCGLMDWGRVGQLNLAFALWGCLSGAPLDIWDRELDRLLNLFVTELDAHGGPALDPATLKRHMQLYIAVMGLAWLLDSPARILDSLPDPGALTGVRDSVLREHEEARSFLNIFIVLLYLWRTQDFSATLRQLLEGRD